MKTILLSAILALAIPLSACGPTPDPNAAALEPLAIGAIPDRDPELLQRRYRQLTEYLAAELDVPVRYIPVTNYAGAVSAFRVGDLDLVWFGGLTGVQARLQVPGAAAIAQRDIDAQFHSVFIVNTASGIEPIATVEELSVLAGRRLTFGSESSTSGRLMPQYFLQQAGLTLDDFAGDVGFSGSHDATWQLVAAGSFEAGVLNEQVWLSRVEAGEVDADRVQVLWRTPPYYDYHWVIHPQVRERYGEAFADRVQAALLDLDTSDPEGAAILDLFGAERFIPTQNEHYADIEAIGREIGKIQ